MTAHRSSRWQSSWLAFALCAPLGGCAGADLQKIMATLPPFPAPMASEPAPAPTSATASTSTLAAEPSGPIESSLNVSGTPTGVFSQVARGALGCWFAADGPLKATHVYRAEADPPAKGGAAEIVIHERDNAVRDLRGPRAYRISFAADGMDVRVTTISLKMEQKLAQAMTHDVASWAKGETACQLRALLPPPAPPPTAAKPAAVKSAKAKSPASGGTKQ